MKRKSFFRNIGALALAPQLVGACSRGGALPDSRALVATPEQRAAYLQGLLEELCALGPRQIGGQEALQAAEIIRRELARALPETELDSFETERWVLLGQPELHLGERRLETYPAHGSAGTPPEGLIGALRKNEREGEEPWQVVDPATDQLLACLTVSQFGRAIPRAYYTFHRELRCLPTFNVGREDVPLLEEAAAQGLPIRVRDEVEFRPGMPAANVIGRLPGRSDREVVFLAHLDTVYNSPGANDNTATLIGLLMLAQAFSGVRPRKTLTFVATTGEEYNELGAEHYAARRRAEGTLEKIDFLLNFDSITWGLNLKINTDDDPAWERIVSLDRELGLPGEPQREGRDGFQLDNRPFRGCGARAIYINTIGHDLAHLWHRPEDTPETVPLDCVENFYRLFHELTAWMLSV